MKNLLLFTFKTTIIYNKSMSEDFHFNLTPHQKLDEF